MRRKAQIEFDIRNMHPCPDCGKPIQRRSKRCVECAHNARRIIRVCIDCGSPVTGKATRCRKCSDIYLHEARKGIIKHKRGSEHPNWKGGRIYSSGYVFVYKPEHPKANRDGYVREHILVWEQTHGKPLPNGWIIHHLNGVKDDNKPRNLVGLSSKKHSLVLQAKAKRIQELEALLNGQGHLI